MVQDSADHFKIGMLAPSGFGKTSLVTAILQEALFATARGELTILPVGRRTEERLNRNRRELEHHLVNGKFEARAVHGTREEFDFEARITYGELNTISVQLRDFPGAWMSEQSRGQQTRSRWVTTRSFLGSATILLVPVDAVLVMESYRTGRLPEFAELAALAQLRKEVQRWTDGRAHSANEPALALICPVKCESYFADNGGRQDEADALRAAVCTLYADVLQPLRELKNALTGARILYAPVDTIGCVELTSVRWGGLEDMLASYEIREPTRLSRAGASDVMWAVHQHLLRVLRASLDAEGASASVQAAELDQLLRRGAPAPGPRVREL